MVRLRMCRWVHVQGGWGVYISQEQPAKEKQAGGGGFRVVPGVYRAATAKPAAALASLNLGFGLNR